MPSKHNPAAFRTRRQLLKTTGCGLALIPLASLLPAKTWAAERITLDHPTVGPLGYVHDVSTIDLEKFPRRAGPEGAKQFCHNCIQYKATEAEWGTCALFPNYLVAREGWCNVWVPTSQAT